MKLELRSHNTELGEEVKHYIERCLQFSLRRFERRVAHVTVWITDLNGHRGGIDKCCRASARIVPIGQIVVRATSPSIHAAIDNAAGRLKLCVNRHLRRARAVKWRNPKPEGLMGKSRFLSRPW